MTATDATGLTVSYTFTLQISNITITSSSNLPVAVVGVPYSFSFSAMGGVATLSWSATGLPSGLSLSTSGLLSGTPNFTGNVNVLITVTDGAISFTKRYVIFGRDTNPTELDISIGSAALVDTTVGKSTSYTLPADGGLPPYTWSIRWQFRVASGYESDFRRCIASECHARVNPARRRSHSSWRI